MIQKDLHHTIFQHDLPTISRWFAINLILKSLSPWNIHPIYPSDYPLIRAIPIFLGSTFTLSCGTACLICVIVSLNSSFCIVCDGELVCTVEMSTFDFKFGWIYRKLRISNYNEFVRDKERHEQLNSHQVN